METVLTVRDRCFPKKKCPYICHCWPLFSCRTEVPSLIEKIVQETLQEKYEKWAIQACHRRFVNPVWPEIHLVKWQLCLCCDYDGLGQLQHATAFAVIVSLSNLRCRKTTTALRMTSLNKRKRNSKKITRSSNERTRS